MFCEHKDILGKPGEGFHKERFMGFARNDLFGTILIILIIYAIYGGNILLISAAVFGLGIILHRLFCVNTTLNKKIFGEI